MKDLLEIHPFTKTLSTLVKTVKLQNPGNYRLGQNPESVYSGKIAGFQEKSEFCDIFNFNPSMIPFIPFLQYPWNLHNYSRHEKQATQESLDGAHNEFGALQKLHP